MIGHIGVHRPSSGFVCENSPQSRFDACQRCVTLVKVDTYNLTDSTYADVAGKSG